MSLSVAMAYHGGDRDQVIRWMEWVRELGGLSDHKFYTLPAFNCEPVPDILPNVRLKDDEQIVSDWQSDNPARSAAAPNSMFRTFAWHFYHVGTDPWLFCEPDCVPLKKGWIDTLEAEYIRVGKPFMGAHVLIEKVPEHMSGNSIYPRNIFEFTTSLTIQTLWEPNKGSGVFHELAFDIAGAAEVLPNAHFTNLIQHKFRHKGFKSREEFDSLIDPDAVLFHSNKDGSIYNFLGGSLNAENMGGKSNDPGCFGASPLPAQESQSESAADNKLIKDISCALEKSIDHELTATFPQKARELSEALASLADTRYHRLKVRDALKKVGLI